MSQHGSGEPANYSFPPPSMYSGTQYPPSSHCNQPDNVRQHESDDGGEESAPPKKKRRRQALSCTECKRRKIKCDRLQPCGPCSRRGEQSKCQWHVVEPLQQWVARTEYDELKTRVDALEATVARLSSTANTTSATVPYPMGTTSTGPPVDQTIRSSYQQVPSGGVAVGGGSSATTASSYRSAMPPPSSTMFASDGQSTYTPSTSPQSPRTRPNPGSSSLSGSSYSPGRSPAATRHRRISSDVSRRTMSSPVQYTNPTLAPSSSNAPYLPVSSSSGYPNTSPYAVSPYPSTGAGGSRGHMSNFPSSSQQQQQQQSGGSGQSRLG